VARIRVEVEQDHLERLMRGPLNGLAELVWNSLDADATKVDVEIERSPLGGVSLVRVTDNGRGMSPERIAIDFAHLGGSWKKVTSTSEGGRALHGYAGQGRFAAFGLGGHVQWTTVADAVTGERVETVVTGNRRTMRDFDVAPPVPQSGGQTGTVVEVSEVYETTDRAISRPGFDMDLTAIFALYLERYPVEIRLSGTLLDPSDLQRRRETFPIDWDGQPPADLTVIEWKNPTKRALHLCDASGVSLHEMAPGIQAPGFEFTAYLSWPNFKALTPQLILEEMAEEPVPTLIDAAKGSLRQYFQGRAGERAAELVEAWKADRTYPYEGSARNNIERAERELFEIMAVAAAPVVEEADTKSRKLSLRLLREAIEQSPGTVHELLQEVLDLPVERLQELRALVEKTSLAAIISAARRVTDRLDFLQGIETIVLGPDFRRHLRERSQLHKILATETWIFREEYALTADDNTLRTALRDHIKILGRNDLAPDDASAPVLDEDGREIVVDLMLSRVTEQRRNEREHLVIELKRPTVHVGGAQITQIQNYATTVKNDPRFALVDTRWEFWIVGDVLDSTANDMANQANREPGIITISPDGKFVVRAVTWAQVIQDARHRLSFVRTALDYASDTDRGLEYLRREHGRFLPPIASDGSDGQP
jgi:hypothetical protein